MAEAEAKAQEVGEREATGNLVRYETADGVALLTLNDPPANTYTYEMMQELDRSILAARMDESVHVIVITGGGEKFFCAGANIQMLTEMTPEFKYFFCLHANETLSRLEQTPKLVIAAVNGHCVGGGLEVALAADLRVARKGAGKMGLPEVSLGVLPGTGGTQRLARIVGKSRAIELMATGDLFDFERAAQLGLVNHVYEADSAASFLEQALTYARQFTAPHKAARAVGRIKRSVQTGAEIPFESALALERELQQQLFQSEDAREGLSAYVEKRKPHFTGR
jgi:enoyl-CoA hydratase/carnithine racemase